MTNKNNVLILYATAAGSTRDVANAIADEFRKKGIHTDVKNVKDEKPSLETYTAVIMGSAIRYGLWFPEILHFIKANRDRLNQIPVALFNCGMFICDNDPKKQTEALNYNDRVKSLVNSVADTNFAGKIEFSKLGFIEKALTKAIGIIECDKRDFNTIRTWAQEIYPLIIRNVE